MRFALLWFAAFVSTTILDIFWARYTLAVSEKRRLPAAIWSSAISAAGSVAMATYFEDRWLMTAGVAGAFAGTWIGTKTMKVE